MKTRDSAHEIFANVRAAGVEELGRSFYGLTFSGLSAGLNIGFSFLAMAAVEAASLPQHATVAGALAYPIGFALVILARGQLFTENTLLPVALVFDAPTWRNVRMTLRLWAIVLLANLAGAAVFAWMIAHLHVTPRISHEALTEVARHAVEGTWGSLLLRGMLGGWLIALVTWMMHANVGAAARIGIIWIGISVLGMAGFSHSVAGAVEVLYLANLGTLSYLDWALDWQLPVTLGNAIGGVVFVTLVNYAQVAGGDADEELLKEAKNTTA